MAAACSGERKWGSLGVVMARFAWLVTLVACANGDCLPPPHLDNTMINEDPTHETYPVGATVTYICDESKSYVKSTGKSDTITCLETSVWSEIEEFCVRSCKTPPRLNYAELEEAFLRLNVFPVGTNVTYKCRPGYKLKLFNRIITCNDDLNWSQIPEFCERKDCRSPGELQNGKVVLPEGSDGNPDTKFGSTATFSCDAGYKLVGRKTRTCTGDKWSNSVPLCEPALCSKPPDIENGENTGYGKEEFTYLQGVTYSCKPTFSLIGDTSIHCDANGQWSGSAPTCKGIQCKDPRVDNGKKIAGFGVSYNYRDSVEFKCNEGFVMEGVARIQCGEDNDWRPQLPVCQRIQCKDPRVDNGAMIADFGVSYKYKDSVEFKCNEGFVMEGVARIQCGEDSDWHPQLPVCQIAPVFSCKMPPPHVAHGHVSQIPGSSKDLKFHVMCKIFYHLNGTEQLQCSKNEGWSSVPTCELSIGAVVAAFLGISCVPLIFGLGCYYFKKKQGMCAEHQPTKITPYGKASDDYTTRVMYDKREQPKDVCCQMTRDYETNEKGRGGSDGVPLKEQNPAA